MSGDRAGTPAAGADAVPIDRVRARAWATVCGEIVGIRAHRVPGPVVEVDLDDGTGAVTLRFLGRTEVPGICPGERVVAAATVVERRGRLEMWNPHWSLLPGSGGV